MTRRFPFGAAVLLAAAFAVALPDSVPAQPNLNVNFIELAHVDTYAQYNDCWGYRDPSTGNEYAILGTTVGVSIWNITDPFNPYETGLIPGPVNGWRDVETYGDNLYAVSEGDIGLKVIDLSNPEAPVLVNSVGDFAGAHTLHIDQESGILYVNGADDQLGFRAFDLAPNPNTPLLIAARQSPYFHDTYSKNGRLYGACIQEGGRVDVLRNSDLPAYSVMTTITYPQGNPGTHNVWTSDDGNYLYTTDESLGSGTVRVFDVADTSSILQVNQFPVWTNTSVHNVYVKNDTAWCSWYEEGVRVFDVTDPLNEVLIGSFDTGPDTNGPFGSYAGCWAVYPFLPSGVIVSSDILQGMHLTYYADEIGAARVFVKDAITNAPIPYSVVRVPEFFDRTDTTNSIGRVRVTLPAGTFEIIATAEGYDAASGSVVVIDVETTPLDIALFPSATGVAPDARDAARITLSAPVPNPSRGATTFRLSLPSGGDASLVVYDASGRRVRTLVSETLAAGQHAIRWDGRSDAGREVPSGAFFARLTAGAEVRSTRLLVTR